ncbi:type VII secretion protein EssB/YukC, partial [Staphylococcus aureus]|uniref:type VII secretion protein EssB/YukC n=1 Tax=Staphylococcus aureus TaxID=1280 RepID=UPI00358FF6EB
YLLYWMELGQGHLDEAINIATYLDDNDITKLALINKLNEIKNIKQEFIENGRKEIYKRTYKD